MASLVKTDKISTTAGGAQEFTIPAADGTANQNLKTDGSGVLGWASPPTANPLTLTGSTNTWIPTITGADALTGTANFTYDGNTLDVKNSGTASSINLYCETSNLHYTKIKSGPHASATSYTITLPNAPPTVSGQALTATTAGVGSWATVGGNNAPAFYVWRQTSHQSIPHDTLTKVAFNGEIYDPDNVFDSTTNYRFTVPAGEGGNYFLFWDVSFEALSNTTFVAYSLYLRVNGTNKLYSHTNYTGSYIRRTGIPGSVMLALSAADYVEIWVAGNTTNAAALDVNYSSGYVHTGFGGFKLL